MLIYLYGKDTKRSREHVERLVEKFIRERDPERLNVKRVSATEADGSAIQTELMSAPFLASKRMVIVERLLEGGDDDLLQWFQARFVEQEPPADLITVLWEEEPVKKSKAGGVVESLHAVLSKSKFAQFFEPLEGLAREQLVVRMVAERGGSITQEAAVEIARRVADEFELSNVIDILVSYVGGPTGQLPRPVTKKDADEFLLPDIENTIFAAMDQLSMKNRAAALRSLANVWYADNDPVYIFAMLHRQVRLLFEAREILDDNPTTTDQALAKKLNVHPFVGKKLLNQARRWTRADLISWYDRLIEIDHAIKHGSNDPRVLIDRFVAV